MAQAEKPHLDVEITGEGECALIFVHGGACAKGDWRFQAEELSSRYRVVTLDLPGHGKSDPPDTTTVATLADPIVDILSAQKNRAVLVGHSLGCRVILEAYRRAPNSVAALIFVDGSLSASDGDLLPVAKTKQLLREMGVDAFLNFSFRQMFVAGSSSKLVEQIVLRARRSNTAVVEAALLDAIHFDACQSAEILAQIAVPVLLLQSSSIDAQFERISLAPGMRTPWTALVARTVPHHELRIVEGAGHFPHLEVPDAVNAHIAHFMEESVLVSSDAKPSMVEAG
jgi:pimeloyl-ACP methyl ester carboxylesterase